MTLVDLVVSVMLICSPNSDISDKCIIIDKDETYRNIYLCGDEFDFGTVTVGMVNLNYPTEINIVTITSECING